MGRGVGGGGRDPVAYNLVEKNPIKRALDGLGAMIDIREKGGVANEYRRRSYGPGERPD
jgi:hypothetical protein